LGRNAYYTTMKIVEKFIDPLQKNFRFVVGQNAQENFDIIDRADGNDYWFHVQNEPSCHVICDLSNNTIEYDKKQLRYILKQGAVVCKQFSKYKSIKDLTIVYTQIKYVAKTNTIGTVSVENGKTIVI